MASLQFEGDVSGISERQDKFIREVLEKQGFNDSKVFFEKVGKTGDNYASNVKRLTVSNGNKDVKMILKIAPENDLMRTVMNAALMFNNEITMYEKVLPKLTSLQASVGVPEEQRIHHAKCYGCLSEPPHELILLEDLTQSDYVMLDRFVSLDDDAVKSTLKNFALLHSLSFALKHLEPETFEHYKNKLSDIMGLVYQNEAFKNMFSLVESSAISVLEDENDKKAVREVLSQWLVIFNKIQKYENSNHFIFQQGDAWTNNIMFKLKEEKVVDSIMIDYQLSKATNPVCDLHYMIFNCTDHSSRLKYYHDWINYYHEELDRSLSNFGLKASLIYSKDQLDADLKRYSKLFFCTSVLLYGMLSRNEEEAAMAKDAMNSNDIDEMGANMSVAYLSKNTIDIFRSRITDLIASHREFGYLA